MESRSSQAQQVTTTTTTTNSKKGKRKGQGQGHHREDVDGIEELTLSIDLEDKPKVNGVHSPSRSSRSPPLEEETSATATTATSPKNAPATISNNRDSSNNVINTHERCSSTSPPSLVSLENCNGGDSDLGFISEGEVSAYGASVNYCTSSSSDRLLTLVKDEPDEYGIRYLSYESELQMPSIMKLIQKDLSEPYSVYTYRYFIHNWPKLCFLAMDEDRMVGAIVCKLDVHKQINKRGYIAMLAVDEKYRRKKIGSNLVLKSIRAMAVEDADEANLDFGLQIVLETEITNKSALRLYENLGFVRDKRLFRYYLNGVDALRLKLWLK